LITQNDIRAGRRVGMAGPVDPYGEAARQERSRQIREASAEREKRAADRDQTVGRLLGWLEIELGGREGALAGNRYLHAEARSLVHDANVALARDARNA